MTVLRADIRGSTEIQRGEQPWPSFSTRRATAELLRAGLTAPNASGILCKPPLSMLRLFASDTDTMCNTIQVIQPFAFSILSLFAAMLYPAER